MDQATKLHDVRQANARLSRELDTLTSQYSTLLLEYTKATTALELLRMIGAEVASRLEARNESIRMLTEERDALRVALDGFRVAGLPARAPQEQSAPEIKISAGPVAEVVIPDAPQPADSAAAELPHVERLVPTSRVMDNGLVLVEMKPSAVGYYMRYEDYLKQLTALRTELAEARRDAKTAWSARHEWFAATGEANERARLAEAARDQAQASAGKYKQTLEDIRIGASAGKGSIEKAWIVQKCDAALSPASTPTTTHEHVSVPDSNGVEMSEEGHHG